MVVPGHLIWILWRIYNLFRICSSNAGIFREAPIRASVSIYFCISDWNNNRDGTRIEEVRTMRALLVALGAGFGAPARYVIDYYIKKSRTSAIPYETLGINILGSFILGLVIDGNHNTSLLLGTGFAGAFTTWSTLALEQYQLVREGKKWSAVIYLLLTLVLGIGAAALGIYLAK